MPVSITKSLVENPGEVPARNKTAIPWSDVTVDLIVHWKITIGGRYLTIKALTAMTSALPLE
jgi:hypothetical protein